MDGADMLAAQIRRSKLDYAEAVDAMTQQRHEDMAMVVVPDISSPLDVKDLTPIPDYGDLMPNKEFIEACTIGAFVNYDGHGYWATKEGYERKKIIKPSDVMLGVSRPPVWSTHCLWMNR